MEAQCQLSDGRGTTRTAHVISGRRRRANLNTTFVEKSLFDTQLISGGIDRLNNRFATSKCGQVFAKSALKLLCRKDYQDMLRS